MNIDIEQLVADKHLDLHAIFREATWKPCEHIVGYTLLVDDINGLTPVEIEVWLEQAQEYGITVWRWRAGDAGGEVGCGLMALSRDAALEDGQEYADANDAATEDDNN